MMKTKRSFSADRLVLYFNTTPRELLGRIEALQARSRWTGPFGFSYAYRENAPRGEPPLFISIPLARHVSSRSEYQNLAQEIAMEFDGWGLNPVLRFTVRFPAAVCAGIYDPPCAPGAKLDPEACLSIMI